jgi:hypothetical protein
MLFVSNFFESWLDPLINVLSLLFGDWQKNHRIPAKYIIEQHSTRPRSVTVC